MHHLVHIKFITLSSPSSVAYLTEHVMYSGRRLMSLDSRLTAHLILIYLQKGFTALA